MKTMILAATALTFAASASAQERQQQSVVRAGTPKAQPAPAVNFTGAVTVAPVTKAVAPGQAGAGLVTFQPGARSHWHTHPAGQILYVTQGCGWTQVEGGPVQRICQGDTVYAPPGLKHWHGATPASSMSHLAITETAGGKSVDWLEPVTAAQYRGPAR